MPQTIKNLNNDILFEVLDILRDTSLRSLLNVALTSSALYHLSQRFIYRTLHFTFNRNRREINGKLIKRLHENAALCAKVREVVISWAPNANLQPGEGSKEELELLGKALPRMVLLEAFTWDAQYPIIPWLLDVLKQHHSSTRLYIRHPSSQTSAQSLKRLQGLPNLFSLDVTLASWQYSACRELEKLLDSSRPKDISMDTSFYCSSDPQPLLGPLELRSLEVYSCLNNSWRPTIKWPVLQRLCMDSISWLPEIAPQLTDLISLQLYVENNDHRVFLPSFLRSCERLKDLDLSGYTGSLKTGGRSLWRHLGKTLVKLRIHEDKIHDNWGRPSSRINADIEIIANECPRLRSLGLRLWGYEQQVQQTLKRISIAFWFIVHLELKMVVMRPVPAGTLYYVTLKYVSVLWNQMWQDIQSSRRRNSHDTILPRLRSLDVTEDSGRLGDWGLTFTADLAERDDEVRSGIAVVKCAELESLRSKLSSVEPPWNKGQERMLKVLTQRANGGDQDGTNMDLEMIRPPSFWDHNDANRFFYRREAVSHSGRH